MKFVVIIDIQITSSYDFFIIQVIFCITGEINSDYSLFNSVSRIPDETVDSILETRQWFICL